MNEHSAQMNRVHAKSGSEEAMAADIFPMMNLSESLESAVRVRNSALADLEAQVDLTNSKLMKAQTEVAEKIAERTKIEHELKACRAALSVLNGEVSQ